jgi:hypothetical protein
MKYVFSILIVILFAACAGHSDKTNSDSLNNDSAQVESTAFNSPIGGVYSFGTNPEAEAVGTVMIYPESDSTFLFWIDFTRGAPSYNMAQLANRGKIVGDTGIYYSEVPDEVDACKIKFYFKKDFVQIENEARNCGFGANCVIDHVYDRRSSVAPEYYVGPEGDTVFFSNLSKALK